MPQGGGGIEEATCQTCAGEATMNADPGNEHGEKLSRLASVVITEIV